MVVLERMASLNTTMIINEVQAHTITELSAAIFTPLDIERMAAQALDHLQHATHASYLMLSILPMPETRLTSVKHELTWAGNQPLPESFSPKLTRLCHDVQAEKHPVSLVESGMAVTTYPLIVRAQLLGCLTLGWDDQQPADLDPVFVELMVHIISLAVQNTLEYQTKQYYVQALEYLGGFSTELNMLSDSQEVLKRAENTGCVLLNVEHGMVLLTTNGIIRKMHSLQLSKEFAELVEGTNMEGWNFNLDKPLSDARHTITFANLDGAKMPDLWRDAFKKEGVCAGIMTLLRGHKQPIGCLGVFFDTVYTPTLYEIRLVEILADQVAVALENIQLNADNRKHAEMLEARVSERTRELAVALDKAEDADRLKSQLLSTVSHELRTPLAVIKAHATTILTYYDRLPKDRQIHYLATMNDEADRLSGLINSLLDMSRLESGQLQIKTERVSLPGVVEPLLDTLRARYTDRQVQGQIPASVADIVADAERLRQVISNLVDNAAKYSPPGTRIEVGARGWEDGLEIWVKDEGNGMTSEQRRRVFDRFYQIDGSSQNARSGFGLGLSICKGLVEQMGGRIWVESAGPGTGSRFAFVLPWAR